MTRISTHLSHTSRPAPPEPILIPPPPARGRFWIGLGASVALHLLVMTSVVIARRTDARPPADGPAAAPVEQVDMVYLPPPPPVQRARPAPPPQPEAEPEPVRETMPRPQVERGPDVPEEVVVRPDPPPELPPGAGEPERAPGPPTELASAPPAAETPAPAPAAAPTIESEAQRLFGNHRRSSEARGPIPAESWATAMTEDRENDCRPAPAAARAPGTQPEMGFVAGRVYREGTREPLVGAHLQIIGTPYSAFSDEQGDYRLLFDKALVDNCRTQYVQVVARGFAPRRLILGLGPRAQNDIPLSRRAM